MADAEDRLRIVPANQSRWEDLQMIFGGRAPVIDASAEVSRPSKRRVVMRIDF